MQRERERVRERTTHVDDKVTLSYGIPGILHLLDGKVLEHPTAVSINTGPIRGEVPIKRPLVFLLHCCLEAICTEKKRSVKGHVGCQRMRGKRRRELTQNLRDPLLGRLLASTQRGFGNKVALLGLFHSHLVDRHAAPYRVDHGPDFPSEAKQGKAGEPACGRRGLIDKL